MDNTGCRILDVTAYPKNKTWEWDSWYDTGSRIDIDCLNWSNRKLLKYLRDNAGILSDYSKGKVFIEDDQYNLVICDKNNRGLYTLLNTGIYYEFL